MFRLIFTATANAHGLLGYAPSNLLLDHIRTRRDPKWALWAMLIAVPYFAIAYWCTTIIDNGGPGWLHLVVLVCIWNALKFLIMGPVTLARLTRDHVQAQRRASRQASSVDDTEPVDAGRI